MNIWTLYSAFGVLAIVCPVLIWRQTDFQALALIQSVVIAVFFALLDWFYEKDPFFYLGGLTVWFSSFALSMAFGWTVRKLQLAVNSKNGQPE